MKRNFLRSFISILLSAVIICGIMSGCGNNDPDRPALTVWVYANEYKQKIEQSFCSDMSSLSWDVNIVTVPVDELDARLSAAQQDGCLPDVFMLSPDNLPYYIESPLTADLTALGFTADSSLYYDYTTAMSSDSEGALKALCWQPDPGLFLYRRSIAKFYLGTDDPAEIQERLSTWDGFLRTARTINEKSEGKTRMLAGVSELVMPYIFSDPEGWIGDDGLFRISQRANELLDYATSMYSESLTYNAEKWSETWLAGIKDPQAVFGYFSSGIGIESIMRKACGGTISGEGSFGDWAAIAGPSGYNWGGCWFAVSADSDMKSQASVFLEYFFSETSAMQKNCLVFGTFSPSRTTVEYIKYDPQFVDSFLSGQNYFVQMASAASDITSGKNTPYDKVIDELFVDCLESCAYGYMTREQAVDKLYSSVQAVYPELF